MLFNRRENIMYVRIKTALNRIYLIKKKIFNTVTSKTIDSFEFSTHTRILKILNNS